MLSRLVRLGLIALVFGSSGCCWWPHRRCCYQPIDRPLPSAIVPVSQPGGYYSPRP